MRFSCCGVKGGEDAVKIDEDAVNVGEECAPNNNSYGELCSLRS